MPSSKRLGVKKGDERLKGKEEEEGVRRGARGM